MLLARKVLVAKWAEAHAELDAPVPADPLGDLKTDNNELSVWEVADDLADLDDLIAAMASVFENLSSCDVALVPIQLNSWEFCEGGLGSALVAVTPGEIAGNAPAAILV